MKIYLSLVCLVACAFAQEPSARAVAACGANDVRYDVSLETAAHTSAPLEPGKARVYFIQDDGPWGDYQHSVLRIGMNGSWVGAYKKNSYFAISVVPGEHHVCVNVQSSLPEGRLVGFAHFTAEPGKTYYYRTQFLSGTSALYRTPPNLVLDSIDSDQAEYLISVYPWGRSHPRK
jgi:hypothetical protein